MLAIEHVEQRVDEVAARANEPMLVPASEPARQDDEVLDGWIASLTADQFERVLASLARVPARW